MSCESVQEKVSLFIDDALDEAEQAPMFAHLKECEECRHFLGSLMRFRKASARERDLLQRQADEILPSAEAVLFATQAHTREARTRSASPPAGARGAGRALRLGAARPAVGRGMPVPLALGIALLLLVAGLLIGTRIGGPSGPAPAADTAAGVSPASKTVIVCGLPAVEVVGPEPVGKNRPMKRGDQP
jgi:hypothetical protein